jgi:hypothetical protein
MCIFPAHVCAAYGVCVACLCASACVWLCLGSVRLGTVLRNALSTADATFGSVDVRIERLLAAFELVQANPNIRGNYDELRRVFADLGVISDSGSDESDDDNDSGNGGDEHGGGGGSDNDQADGFVRRRRRQHQPPGQALAQALAAAGSEGIASIDDSIGAVVANVHASGPHLPPTVSGTVWPPAPALQPSERFCRPLCRPGWAGVPVARCNCGQAAGCIVDGGDVGKFLDDELEKASDPAPTFQSNGFRSLSREGNNIQRKRCYRWCAIWLHFTYREPLPECLVARVRCCWPALSGVYMGFKGW